MSIWPITLIAALVVAAAVWPVRRRPPWNAVVALGLPWALAYCIYWFPVWLRPPDRSDFSDLHRLDMYNAWAALEIIVLAAPAMLVAVTIVVVSGLRRWRQRGDGIEKPGEGSP